ncbi:MAG: gluconokinase, partial [Deinococcales bacterium]
MPDAVVVMGVSGSGKTTVGKRLASRLGFAFADADAYHPQANIDKMAAGVPLTDEDREPWLGRLRALIEEHAAEGRSLVLACSALKERYRRTLKRAEPAARVQIVYLKGDFDTILARMRRRKGHYMKAGMLQSQFRDLEEPTDAVTVDVDRLGVPASVRRALAGLAARG